ncbi:MAG: hypothetical protein U0T81_04590 [Saprospiraceae bacterium]
MPFLFQVRFDVAVDHNGYKWLVFRDGLAVFDDRNTPSTSDDRFIALNTSTKISRPTWFIMLPLISKAMYGWVQPLVLLFLTRQQHL